jgi:hypothetical protein
MAATDTAIEAAIARKLIARRNTANATTQEWRAPKLAIVVTVVTKRIIKLVKSHQFRKCLEGMIMIFAIDLVIQIEYTLNDIVICQLKLSSKHYKIVTSSKYF